MKKTGTIDNWRAGSGPMTDSEIGILLNQTRTEGYASDVRALVHAVQAAERERCAKLCDPTNSDRPEDWTEYAKTRAECAARIRGA